MKKMRVLSSAAALLLCAAAFAPAPGARAAAITFSDFSSVAGLQLNNATAAIHGCPSCGAVTDDQNRDVLRLTNALSQSGSAFSTSAISLDQNASFSTAFQFRITNPQGISDGDGQGADGIVFVVQTVDNTAGGFGQGIGYSGIPNSLGVEFDTWNNAGQDQNDGNHVGVNLNGSVASSPLVPVATRMNNGEVWHAWVDYDGTTDNLQVRLSETAGRPLTAMIDITVDLVSVLGTTDAFVGFTSGTGAAAGNHDILAWQFNAEFNPIEEIGVPAPAPLALFALGLAAIGFGRRRQKRVDSQMARREPAVTAPVRSS
jgi:hypothetical protein